MAQGLGFEPRRGKAPLDLKKRLHGHLGRVIIGAIKKPIWTKDGNININTLKQFTHTQDYQKLDSKTKHQINLAITLSHLRKKK